MAAIRAGIAVLVIGPTVTGGTQAVGHDGTVNRFVASHERVPECGDTDIAFGDGWLVNLGGSCWPDAPETCYGVFPAISLMPLDGEAEPESVTRVADKPQPVEA